MSRIDPIRRGDLLRRSVQRDAEEPHSEAEVVRLPVPVQRVSRILPRNEPSDREAAFAAQLMGQQGAKRGLRAGPELFDSAKMAVQVPAAGARTSTCPKLPVPCGIEYAE